MGLHRSVPARRVRRATVLCVAAGLAILVAAPTSSAAVVQPERSCTFDPATGTLDLRGGVIFDDIDKSKPLTGYEMFRLEESTAADSPADLHLLSFCHAGEATVLDVRHIVVEPTTDKVIITLHDERHPDMKGVPTVRITGPAPKRLLIGLSYTKRAKPFVIAPVTALGPEELDVNGDNVADVTLPDGQPWSLYLGWNSNEQFAFAPAYSGSVDLRKMNADREAQSFLDLYHYAVTTPTTVYGPLNGAPVQVRTGNGDDRITTYGGGDLIDTYGGDDVVSSGGGDDAIGLGAGHDVARAGAGNDRMSADQGVISWGSEREQTGNDYLYGGTGSNYYALGGGFDRVVGGPGRDFVRTYYSRYRLALGAGDDIVGVWPNAKYGTVPPGFFRNRTILCGPGNDTIMYQRSFRPGTFPGHAPASCERMNPRILPAYFPWSPGYYNERHYYCGEARSWCPNSSLWLTL